MHYEIKIYKDGQVSAKIISNGNLEVKIRGNSYQELFEAATVKEAWDAKPENKHNMAILTIYCLIGQRSDRRFNPNESFDLKVISRFINAMGFDQVKILHPHSDITLALIDRSVKCSHFDYVKRAFDAIGNPTLISPDAGAYKASHAIAEQLGADLIPSNKVRINGEPVINVQGEVKGLNCLIIDDLADGGRTFVNLAEALRQQGAKRVYLYVTHGQFNNGFEALATVLDGIYCTNSYRDINHELVTQYKVV